MLSDDDVEIHALVGRGWSVSAIARHTGWDRKTVRKYLTGPLRKAGFREAVGLGFARSYVTFARHLRLLGLRPRCEACRTGGHGVTTVIARTIRVRRSSGTGWSRARRRGARLRMCSSARCRSRGSVGR